MLNRRLIRIKVFKVLFGRIVNGNDSMTSAEAELMNSCEKTLDLYYYILNSALAVKRCAEEKIETGLKKYYPTEEERNPNRKFVNMKFFRYLEEDEDFGKYCDKRGLVWTIEEKPLVRKIFNSMLESDYYSEFMSSPDTSDSAEIKFLTSFFSSEYEDNELLESMLEDMSALWTDDLGYVLMKIIKNIKLSFQKDTLVLPELFASSDDAESRYTENDEQFARKLLRESMMRYSEVKDEVSAMISNWDKERLVFTDMVLISMGVVEAAAFPSIPIKVTINEYVEIAKYYSTPNSKLFVNGILDRILKKKVEDGSIRKSGMGLVEG